MTVFTTRILSTLALAAFILPAAARAEQPAPASRLILSTSGLDPAKPQDQAVLRHRITVAAHKVCQQVMQGDAMISPDYTDCVRRATADARSQLDRQIATATSRAMVASIAPK